MADGDDVGYFGPGSAVWTVNGGTAVLVGGIRALLMQTLHPGAMAGVHDWSRYREDPLGRLAGTVRWVLTTTFDDRAGADAGSAHVRAMHRRVTGSYTDSSNSSRSY
ncbi:MAG TPA: oxygenase MpaB family protein, partial [Glaciihabitans sp.]|nr:oxygenase MpaB family protein [Glaciihabitans sp.]